MWILCQSLEQLTITLYCGIEEKLALVRGKCRWSKRSEDQAILDGDIYRWFLRSIERYAIGPLFCAAADSSRMHVSWWSSMKGFIASLRVLSSVSPNWNAEGTENRMSTLSGVKIAGGKPDWKAAGKLREHEQTRETLTTSCSRPSSTRKLYKFTSSVPPLKKPNVLSAMYRRTSPCKGRQLSLRNNRLFTKRWHTQRLDGWHGAFADLPALQGDAYGHRRNSNKLWLKSLRLLLVVD